MNLFLAMAIGAVLGLVTSLRRCGALVTFIASIASFAATLRAFHLQWIGFIASGGGIGLLLGIIGMHACLAAWAYQLRAKTVNIPN